MRSETEYQEVLKALKNLHATAQAVIVKLECNPVVLSFIQEKLPAGWPMFEECTAYASDAISKAESHP